MIDLAVIGVAAALPAVVGIDVARRTVRARSVRRGVDEYLGWVLADISLPPR